LPELLGIEVAFVLEFPGQELGLEVLDDIVRLLAEEGEEVDYFELDVVGTDGEEVGDDLDLVGVAGESGQYFGGNGLVDFIVGQ